MPKFHDGYKICPKCKVDTHIEDYYKNRRSPTGRGSWCKLCVKEAYSYPRWRKSAVYMHKYGINMDDYDSILECQHGGCNICGKTVDEAGYDLHVDHDHATGVVRGLLCAHCNSKLGWFEKRQVKIEKHLTEVYCAAI